MLDRAMDWGEAYLGPDSAYRGLVLALATLLILVFVRGVFRRRLARYVQSRAHRAENAERFLRGYDVAWKVAIAVVVLVAAGGSFRLLGLSVALLGTMLGWSLQVPIRGLAAWFMVVLKRPFRIGDRIAVAGVVGDVTDIQLNHIILNQVGGTVEGEERSGRGILVPTAMLFGENIVNYHYFGQQEAALEAAGPALMLDEVLVRVTFGCDYALAKRLCVEAAAQAVAELVGGADQTPFTRSEFTAWGILIRVRYHTPPVRRQEVSSRVTELIWEAFRRHPGRVRFCLPASVVSIVRRPGREPPPMAPGGSPA
ncbi:MAG: hypothetical protein AMK73_07865 [Planctomycetes bacterium SM23_32]|nr:MAG: hypothetical protein AMK73_07865 [Planctomycetes bacterium SM23_32]